MPFPSYQDPTTGYNGAESQFPRLQAPASSEECTTSREVWLCAGSRVTSRPWSGLLGSSACCVCFPGPLGHPRALCFGAAYGEGLSRLQRVVSHVFVTESR